MENNFINEENMFDRTGSCLCICLLHVPHFKQAYFGYYNQALQNICSVNGILYCVFANLTLDHTHGLLKYLIEHKINEM